MVRYEDIKKSVSTEVQFVYVYIFATCSDYIIALYSVGYEFIYYACVLSSLMCTCLGGSVG